MQNINNTTITVEQVAKALNISRASAYTLVKHDEFPKIRIGKRIIIPIDAFYKWIEVNTEGISN